LNAPGFSQSSEFPDLKTGILLMAAERAIGDNDSMNSEITLEETILTREEMARLLNEDLAGEYQAVIAYIVYSQVIKGAAYTAIAKELRVHAAEEMEHALKIAQQVDYFGGMPTVTPKSVKTSNDAKQMLRFDLENERITIANYRERIKQAEAMGEFALSETLREIILQEQEHEIDLCNALGINLNDDFLS